MLDKLFGRGRKKAETSANPEILFGRYSDNNKPLSKVARWTDADNLFKEKKYADSLDAFFEYLRDDAMQNVVYERNNAEGRFEFYQGSKIVRGNFDKEYLKAEVTLAKMPQPSTPVMRRLLEMNFNLYYSRFALDNERLCMRFDSDIGTANPSKLYYGLKELATKGDKQDDLLIQDFNTLQIAETDHISELPASEKEMKYEWLQKWIKQTLDAIDSLDADKFSGGISYVLLSLIYKIDYLIAPQGTMMNDLERIAGIYFQKDEKPAIEKNRNMIEEFKRMQGRNKEDVLSHLFRSKYTFSIVAPQQHKVIAESIHAANQNMSWYRDNNYPFVASQIIEYGIAYCQYAYSLPRAITELVHLYMMINYSDYFAALGFREVLYDSNKNQFNIQVIIGKIKEVKEKWKDKHPFMNIRTQNLRFDNQVNFNWSFTNEMELLNMDSK